ncbi:MAG: cation-efflux pump [Nitrosomonadales bacterium]|nr:MAG: cation-efflux pump [Nitrosomonadales bacterium]
MEEHGVKPDSPKGAGHHYHEAKKVTLVSVVVNIALTLLQIVVGIIGKSSALVADGMHSLSDLLCDFLVLFANRHGSKDADKDHPYGHARIETATTFVLGVILMGTGAALLWGAAQRLQDPAALQKVHFMTLWIAVLTLLGKEGLFRYMLHVARKLRSRMLEANAWHARSDAASSVIVVAGIAGNLAGVTSLDLLAAALVAAMIFRMGWKQAYHALMELIDTSLDEKEVAAIRTTLLATPGVRGLHELRTRRMGDRALVDAHVLVDPKISVSEGHYVAETARARVVKAHGALDVMIHIDPEDDSAVKRSLHLPPREVLLAHLEQQLAMPLPLSCRVALHYLDGRVEADIFLAGPAPDDAFARAAAALPADDPYFGAIRLFHELAP